MKPKPLATLQVSTSTFRPCACTGVSNAEAPAAKPRALIATPSFLSISFQSPASATASHARRLLEDCATLGLPSGKAIGNRRVLLVDHRSLLRLGKPSSAHTGIGRHHGPCVAQALLPATPLGSSSGDE